MSDARLMQALREIRTPDGRDIVAAGLVDGLQARDGLVQLSLFADRARLAEMEAVGQAAEALLRRQPGVLNATVVLTAHRQEPGPPKAAAPSPHGRPDAGEKFLTGVRFVIAIASGKGGVGKSTLAVNLAVAFAGMGLRTGLIDADIHGPSQARMLGIDRKPEVIGKIMQPIEVFGLKAMSIGFLVPEDQAMIWRGPMVMGALSQMLGQTNWGTLDVMVVDLPPGTGDAQLTLSQKVDVAGVVIVSTPQDIALIDARRGVAMFERVGVRILGLVENMSFFHCPHCGHDAPVFGHGGARTEAARLAVPFLGEVPLLLDVREAADAGTPIVLSAPESVGARAFASVAALVWTTVSKIGGDQALEGPSHAPMISSQASKTPGII